MLYNKHRYVIFLWILSKGKTADTESQKRSHENNMPYFLWLYVESIKDKTKIDLSKKF